MYLLHPALVLLLAASIAPLTAQTDDFNDGNDAGWTRFNPIGVCSFSVAGGGYRIVCTPSPDAVNIGPGRGGSFRQGTSYTKFALSLDIVEWSAAEDASLGLVARVQPSPTAAGTLSCYAVTFNTEDGDLGIQRVENEVPTNLGGYARFTPVAGRPYRLIFTGAGTHLEACLYDLSHPALPVATRVVEDSTFTGGTTGLIAFSSKNTGVTGKFDNFSASESMPPPLDDFNDGNDTGWTRLNPAGTGTYSFPDGGQRLAATPTAQPLTMGSARLAALRAGQTLEDFCVETDLVTWDTTEDSAMGLLARVSQPGAGSTDGYSLTWHTRDNTLQMKRITNEATFNLATTPLELDPSHRYRLVFAGRGSSLAGFLYDLSQPGTALASLAATDAAWSTGLAGVIVLSAANTAASATFDSYSASSGSAPAIRAAEDGEGNVLVWWPWEAALSHRLESSGNLARWDPEGDPVTVHGPFATLVQPLAGKRFFRLAPRP